MKTCITCKEEKEDCEFYIERGRNKRRSYCRQCEAERHKARKDGTFHEKKEQRRLNEYQSIKENHMKCFLNRKWKDV